MIRVLTEPVPGGAGREAAERELGRIGYRQHDTDGLTRAWAEFTGTLADLLTGGLPLLVTALVLAVVVAVIGWVAWRAWRSRGGTPAETVPAVAGGDATDDQLPELPFDALMASADAHAAAGRYAEAVRDRLRAIVRDLMDRGVVEHRPGWTITELAAAAAEALPPVAEPLGEAARIFSDLWYGLRPATADHDARMRALVDAVHATLPTGVAP